MMRSGVLNKTENLETGRRGESLAAEFLQNKGYRIIERNYRTRYAEIDLVAEYKDIIVFVEVRTKKNERFGSPEETINRAKVQKLIKNAKDYMAIKKYDKAYRIDAVCIVLDKSQSPKRLDHYENITLIF
ncbi:MAG: YraN family protein [Candidatus Omnitrophota bacterium]